MRFDDHRGLIPSSARFVRGALRATLVRTKTSGVGKRREELYIHVDAEAWFAQCNWLATGWELWDSCGSDRDYFLGLPSHDRTEMRAIEATYPDSQAMSHALLLSLRDSRDQPLFKLPNAHKFWTEHSDKCSIPSLAGCLDQINVDWINDLGRWGLKMSQTYIRTHLRRVAEIQRTVAAEVRSASDVAERFGEHDLYTGWASFLCAHGSSHEAAVKQAADLLEAGILLLKRTPLEESQAATAEASEEEAGPSAPSTPLLDFPGEGVGVPLGVFVVSLHPRTGFRRLHQVGNCPLVPGADYAGFKVCGELAPEVSAYDATCKHCFGSGMTTEGGDWDVGSGSSSESS